MMRAGDSRWRRAVHRTIVRKAANAVAIGLALGALLGWGLGAVAWAQDAVPGNAAANAVTAPASTVTRPAAVPDTAPPNSLVTVPAPAAPSAEAAAPPPAASVTRTASLRPPHHRSAVLAKDSTPAVNTPFGEFSGNHGPISITSDQLSLDYKKNTAIFSGHARVAQAGGVLTCDKLIVKYTQDSHEVQEAIADGNVRMSQGTRWATSDHAVLNQKNHTVVLTGNPVVHDGNDQVTGRKITVELQTGNSIVDGAAKAVFFPRTAKSGDNQQSTNGDQTSVEPAQ